MNELARYIQSQISISDDDVKMIVSKFSELDIGKGKHLVKKGQVVTSFFFIKKGGLRIYFNKDDKQVTGWLAFENEFFTELNSLKTGKPTYFNIEAIEDTTLLVIDKTQMELLYQTFPLWQQFGRQIWENAFLKVVEAILSYQTMTAEERYLALLQQSDILQRVPLKQLASYLGVTQTSLSRLRKNIKGIH